MNRIYLGLLLAALPAAAAAQQTTKTAQLPVFVLPSTNNLPFGQPVIRYQQWFEGNQLGGITQAPVRIIGLAFPGPIQSGVVFDIEVTMSNAPAVLAGNFQSNFLGNTVVTLPRTKVTPVVQNGFWAIAFPASWVYDGSSDVVVDIKIYGNALGAQWNYSGASTISTLSNTKRQYFVGNANATTANSSGSTGHYGLVTQFLYQEGGTYPYGAGCPGGLNVIPEGTANSVPLPGLSTYAQQLAKAGSGYPAVFLMGISNTTYNSMPLPFPLTFLGGPNCDMVASPNFMVFTMTVGGGPGAGSATIPTPIPGIGALAGVRVYSQWVVFDKAASNGNVSATAGLMHVVGS